MDRPPFPSPDGYRVGEEKEAGVRVRLPGFGVRQGIPKSGAPGTERFHSQIGNQEPCGHWPSSDPSLSLQPTLAKYLGARRKGGRDFHLEPMVLEPGGETPGGSGTCPQTLHEKTRGSTGCPRDKYGVRILYSPAHPLAVHEEMRSWDFPSIMSYNGGAVMAMKGKNCVAIAADRRFGIQAQMVTTDFQKIFPMGDRLYIGLAGLATDVQTVAQRLKFRLNLYELKEGRQIKPYTLMSMVANLLYEKRFGPYYTEPVIAGLDPKTFKPFICSLDLIGCPMVTDDFVVSGTCAEQMYGMCESLWEPNMDPEHLFETISQAMLNAVDRDAVSGMGVIVHIIEKDKITTRTLKARMD
ncbi:Proteasome subunit beta type-3 [Sciurus carolinensis]|nr:Proteasome subunit beta type-3 [Sciurus carolinensis]